MSEEMAEQAGLIEVDVLSLKDKYKKMMKWKQASGTKMNFKSFKEFTDAQKRNASLKRQLNYSPDPNEKKLPIEIEKEKRRRKEPTKFDSEKQLEVRKKELRQVAIKVMHN